MNVEHYFESELLSNPKTGDEIQEKFYALLDERLESSKGQVMCWTTGISVFWEPTKEEVAIFRDIVKEVFGDVEVTEDPDF